MTAYGGLLPVTAILEKLEFRELAGAAVNLELQHMARARNPSDSLLAMILAGDGGFWRWNHLQYRNGSRRFWGSCKWRVGQSRASGEAIARHLARVIEALPKSVETLRARADAGVYGWNAVKAYTELNCECIIVARKTDRFLGELRAADWRSSSQTDADFECQFNYLPGPDAANPDQIGHFDGLACRYRMFVSNINRQIWSPADRV